MQWYGVSTTNEVAGFKTEQFIDLLLNGPCRFPEEALNEMVKYAAQRGANAIIGMRIASYTTEAGTPAFVCYGTAVWVTPQF